MSLTQEEFQEIEKFTKAAPTLFTGFIMDETPQGRANAQSLASFLDGRSQQYTVANLTAAVIALQHVLIWEKGQEPTAQARSTRAPAGTNNGIPRYEGTQYTDRANGIESSWAKDIREGKEKNAARLAAQKKAAERWTETHQVVQGPNGRQNFAASNALNEEARRRHAQEDLAAGKPVRQQPGFRIIPDNETNFKGPAEAPYTTAELSAYLARRKGGHLLR